MKLLKLSTAAIVLLLHSLFYSFSVASEVGISINTDKEFPVLTIINPSGENVIIKPISSEVGSIGFEKDGTVYWIKGKPEIKTGEAGEILHLWKINSNIMVQLQFDAKNDEIDFNFRMIHSIVPDLLVGGPNGIEKRI